MSTQARCLGLPRAAGARENPRLVAIIEIKDAKQLLEMRSSAEGARDRQCRQGEDGRREAAAGEAMKEGRCGQPTPSSWCHGAAPALGERIALEMTSMALWPLQDDARMTVLINLLAAQIDRMLRER